MPKRTSNTRKQKKKGVTNTLTNAQSTIPQKANKICLCMIVKNESKIIERCLNSAKGLIDYVSICDTGSTDSTRETIKTWCEKNSIPGTIHEEEFKNFGYNRTLSAELAIKTYPDATYLLLLDADMILVIKPTFDKTKLSVDKYLIEQFNLTIRYWNVRLLKTSLVWKCVGVTHEYWDSPQVHVGENYKELVIDDREDGGCKTEKYERDKKLLHGGLEDPSLSIGLRSRYMFYLAQTYKDTGDYETAIKWYRKRQKTKDKFIEEIFFCQYRIGSSYELWAKKIENQIHMNEAKIDTFKKNSDPSYQRTKPCKICSKTDLHSTEIPFTPDSILSNKEMNALLYKRKELYYLSICSHLDAWQMRKWRAEPIYDVARIYREQGKNDLALIYALKAKEIPYPSSDILFIDYRVYEYLIDNELSIVAYYDEKFRDIGRNSCKKLLRMKDKLPEQIRNIVIHNSKFYN